MTPQPKPVDMKALLDKIEKLERFTLALRTTPAGSEIVQLMKCCVPRVYVI